MSDDLKPLLLQLLTKTDTILNDVAVLKTDVSGLKTDVSGLKTDVANLKDGQARLEEDIRQVKEMLGIVRLKEVSRLDGRIDQLSLDVSLLRKAAAE